jgi:hypothetical protein
MEFERVRVRVGTLIAVNGRLQDFTQQVEFEARKLAEFHRFLGTDDTRGVSEVLYQTPDGRLIVHLEDWSRWQNEPTHYKLVEITQDDLQPGGRFEFLGREAGIARPLTLDEALGD